MYIPSIRFIDVSIQRQENISLFWVKVSGVAVTAKLQNRISVYKFTILTYYLNYNNIIISYNIIE